MLRKFRWKSKFGAVVGALGLAGVVIGAVVFVPRLLDRGPVAVTLYEGYRSTDSMAWSPDGSILAVEAPGGGVDLVDPTTGEIVQTLVDPDNDEVRSVVWSPDGTKIATGGDASRSSESVARLWDVATGDVIQTLEGHTDQVRSVAWSPDGTTLASGSFDNTVKLWDVATGESIRTLDAHKRGVWSVSWSPDGTVLASGGNVDASRVDPTLKFWDMSTGDLIGGVDAAAVSVQSVAWSPDGSMLAATDFEIINLWDPATGKNIRTIDIESFNAAVNSIAWSPDNGRLATGSDDGTVRVWDVSTGEIVELIEGLDDEVESVAWSPDGATLATGDQNAIKLWTVEGI